MDRCNRPTQFGFNSIFDNLHHHICLNKSLIVLDTFDQVKYDFSSVSGIL